MATDAQDSAWETAATHRSEDLTETECWTLLAGQGTGRVAYSENDRVLVFSGRAAAVVDSDLLTALWGRRMAEPWGGGQRDVFIGIKPTVVTGRRVGMR